MQRFWPQTGLRLPGLWAATWLVAVAMLAAQTDPPALSIAVAARAMQPGEVVVVTATGAAPRASVQANVFGRVVPLFPADAGVFQGLVGIDLDVRPGTYRVTVTADEPGGASRTATRNLVVRAKTFPTRRLTVDPRFVEPPPDVQARIAEENALLGRLWSDSAPRRLWEGPFLPPVPDAANSAFGSRSVFNGQARSPHGGADFASPSGRPVEAPNSGRVVLARDLYYTGHTVVLDHGLGLVSLFAHLSATSVSEGDQVQTGTVVGRVGATGRVTGAHLHWTVRLGGARVDPLSLTAATALVATGAARPAPAGPP
jgi:murein DD-endopeptidase MepM/ murein hydrolase activator NlpD